MQIAARHGYRDGFHPAAALMDRARVIPAATIVLVWQRIFFRSAREKAKS